MEISGKLIQILEIQNGTSAKGEWTKQDFVIETSEQYPKKVCISNWGNKIDLNSLNIGDDLTVSINIESREYNQRWYTEVKAWRLESMSQQSASMPNAAPKLSENDVPEELANDDLPF